MAYLDRLMGRNEEIVFTTREHWVVLLVSGLIDGFVFVVILIGAALALSSQGILAALIILAMLPLLHFVVRYLNWYNARYIVTNRRVMEIRGVINKRVSDSSLEKVNDVVLEQSILGRFLDYGTIEIITGSDIGVNFFKRIAHPLRLKTEMLNQKEDLGKLDGYGARAERVLREEPPTSGDVPELIAELDELRKRGIITEQEFEDKKADLLSRI